MEQLSRPLTKVKRMNIEEFLEIRRKAALEINPDTAEVMWWYAQTLDPYGVDNLPEELQQVGREYFARSPDSDIWVCFCDLPQSVRDAQWEKHRSKLAFPAGLELEALP
jgi:hypothetical protein